jgi:hypothetical protein
VVALCHRDGDLVGRAGDERVERHGRACAGRDGGLWLFRRLNGGRRPGVVHEVTQIGRRIAPADQFQRALSRVSGGPQLLDHAQMLAADTVECERIACGQNHRAVMLGDEAQVLDPAGEFGLRDFVPKDIAHVVPDHLPCRFIGVTALCRLKSKWRDSYFVSVHHRAPFLIMIAHSSHYTTHPAGPRLKHKILCTGTKLAGLLKLFPGDFSGKY